MGGIKGLCKFGDYAYMLALFIYLVRHRREYDLIHIHSMSPSTFVGILAGKLLGKGTICKVMAGGKWSALKGMENNSTLPGTRYMLSFIRRHCDRVVALNGEIAAELGNTGFAPEQIVRIPNGVVVNNWKPTYALHTPAQLIFVGRLQRQKGLDVLLQALAQLKTIRPLPNISVTHPKKVA